MKNILIYSMIFLLAVAACHKPPHAVITIDGATVISSGYIGNGAQWDPYEMDFGDRGRLDDLSQEDWDKIYERLDYMRPAFMRVCINTMNYVTDGKLDKERGFKHFARILDYCQSRGVTVMLGDWGQGMCDPDKDTINEDLIRMAAEYARFLIVEKGYSCIRYYNMVNEPNGWWAHTKGSYGLWARIMKTFHGHMQRMDIAGEVELVGPDAAIWTDRETWWIDSCAVDLKGMVGLYDIHTYPSKVTVNSGEYTEIIGAYKRRVPPGKKIVMGEIGFKYIEPEDSLYQVENKRMIAAKPHASAEDSQMFVFEHMYGTDMADALMQTVNAGYSGCVAWMLDDAMHFCEAPGKLKIWGFWNIMGDEMFGPQEETIRPWFYAWSLLTRYMPAGSNAYAVDVEGEGAIKAVAVEKDGKHMIAIVNIGKEARIVELRGLSLPDMKGVKRFVYSEGNLKTDGKSGLLPDKEGMTLNLNKGMIITLDSETLVVYTDFEF